jgi:O-antigen/teichoic acid export membrane protein
LKDSFFALPLCSFEKEMSNTINISRKDVLWNYAATFLQIGVGIILLPFILRVFPQETVAIWTIFTTIIALSGLLDFGFNPSFARNVSYVVSGVKELKATGYHIVESRHSGIDYSLFKGLINAMKWFYARAATILFVLLATAGTYYMCIVLKTYSGNHTEVYIAWAILIAINAYSLYTMYYDSLMQGKGLIKRSKQIQIVGQSVYLVVAVVLILLRFNLIAVVSAQALSIIIRRILSYKTIYTAEFKYLLHSVTARPRKKIFKAIYPNAMKFGLNGLAGFLTLRSSMIIGSLFLSLNAIASYGITMQIVSIISAVASVYFVTYLPRIAQLRVQDDSIGVKQWYLKSCWFSFFTFIILGVCFIFVGDWVLAIIRSQTILLPKSSIVIILVIALLEVIINLNASTLLSKNEIPFFKTSILVAVVTLVLLFIFFKYTNLGVLGMVIAPGIAECLHWVWMTTAIKGLKIKWCDVYRCLIRVKKIK